MVPKANIWSYNNLKKENLMEKSERSRKTMWKSITNFTILLSFSRNKQINKPTNSPEFYTCYTCPDDYSFKGVFNLKST